VLVVGGGPIGLARCDPLRASRACSVTVAEPRAGPAPVDTRRAARASWPAAVAAGLAAARRHGRTATPLRGNPLPRRPRTQGRRRPFPARGTAWAFAAPVLPPARTRRPGSLARPSPVIPGPGVDRVGAARRGHVGRRPASRRANLVAADGAATRRSAAYSNGKTPAGPGPSCRAKRCPRLRGCAGHLTRVAPVGLTLVEVHWAPPGPEALRPRRVSADGRRHSACCSARPAQRRARTGTGGTETGRNGDEVTPHTTTAPRSGRPTAVDVHAEATRGGFRGPGCPTSPRAARNRLGDAAPAHASVPPARGPLRPATSARRVYGPCAPSFGATLPATWERALTGRGHRRRPSPQAEVLARCLRRHDSRPRRPTSVAVGRRASGPGVAVHPPGPALVKGTQPVPSGPALSSRRRSASHGLFPPPSSTTPPRPRKSKAFPPNASVTPPPGPRAPRARPARGVLMVTTQPLTED